MTLPKRSLVSKCHTTSQKTRSPHFTYVHNRSTVFSAPMFTKRVTAQQHYVQTSYDEFQQNHAKKVESWDENSFTPLSKIWLSLGRFSRNLKSLIFFFCGCLLYRTPNTMENVGSVLKQNVAFIVPIFTTHVLTRITWRFPVPINKYGK